MNKKQLIVAFCIVTLALFNLSCASKKQFDPFPKNTQSDYAYDREKVPAVCFFPMDKARWDGNKLTVKDWSLLTDFQKTMFISEYVDVYHQGIEINGWDYLIALNTFVSKCEDKSTSMIMPMEVLLKKQDENGNLFKKAKQD